MLHVDGDLADPTGEYELFYQALFPERPTEPLKLLRSLPPPRSLSRWCRAAGLDQAEYERMKDALSCVDGLWLDLPLAPGAIERWEREAVAGSVVVSAARFTTERRWGNPLWGDPLVQTYSWLRRHFAPKSYPLLCIVEDRWPDAESVGEETPPA